MSELDERPLVLLVDDSADNLTLLNGVLRDEYRVKAVNNGPRCIKVAQTQPQPDLILLDIMMPQMSGYEVCERLKSDPLTADIPVVFLTAMSSTEDETRGLELGAADFITKPVNPPIVRARVKSQLQAKQAADFLRDRAGFLEAEVERRTRELNAIQNVTIQVMASLAETRDNETGNHIRRTQYYVKALAEHLQTHPRFAAELTEQMIQLMYKSAPLHDIGKVGIPDEILLKPDKLTAQEFEVMKTHTTLGRESIEIAEQRLGMEVDFLRVAKDIACYHHEHWDGTGYPLGLSGESIPMSARLMAVADVYDALISVRPYKRAFEHAAAIEIIHQGRGTHFDPDVVDALLELKDEFRAIAARFKD